MNLKPIIHIRLLLLKRLFTIVDSLSNIERIHKYIINKKIYLGTAIISLTFISNACNSKENSKTDTESKTTKKDTVKKTKSNIDTTSRKIYPTNNKPEVGPTCYFTTPKVIDTVQTVTCYDMMTEVPNNAIKHKTDSIIEGQEENQDTVYTIVDEPATFQGGDLTKAKSYVDKNLTYPEGSAENGMEGRVFIQFVVLKTGKIDRVKIIRNTSGDSLLENEAVRVIKSMPQWTPAKLSGKEVNQQFIMPVIFKINN